MKILMTGATGFVGKRLGLMLHEAGHEITIVTRKTSSAKSAVSYPAKFIECDLQTTALKANDFVGIDVIVNLIGETIDGRWTSAKKKEILNSRILSASHLLHNCPRNLKTIITASAQGFYGDRKDQTVNENSPAGSGFLADVCVQWEAPFKDWQASSETRVVILRLGIVLSRQGGALKKLISLFKKNLGAVLGNGQQWMSFISLEDLCRVFRESVINTQYSGVINAVTEHPVQNKEFTKQLVKALDVIQLPNVPRFVLRALLGEMSALVLDSTKVEPLCLQKLKFRFQEPTLADVFSNEIES